MSSPTSPATHPESTENRPNDDMFLTIDHPFQLTVIRRVGAYALVGIVYFAAISLTTDAMTDPHYDWQSIWMKCCDEAVYWAPGLLFILPTLGIDLLRLTRRFALPVNRIAEEIHLLAHGKSESPLTLDAAEPWERIATDFNQLREELLELRQMSMLAKGRPTAFAASDPAIRITESEPLETVGA